MHPDGHHRLAIALVSLGDVCRYRDSTSEAVELYKAAIEMYRQSDSEKPNELAWALTSLALAEKVLLMLFNAHSVSMLIVYSVSTLLD